MVGNWCPANIIERPLLAVAGDLGIMHVYKCKRIAESANM